MSELFKSPFFLSKTEMTLSLPPNQRPPSLAVRSQGQARIEFSRHEQNPSKTIGPQKTIPPKMSDSWGPHPKSKMWDTQPRDLAWHCKTIGMNSAVCQNCVTQYGPFDLLNILMLISNVRSCSNKRSVLLPPRVHGKNKPKGSM